MQFYADSSSCSSTEVAKEFHSFIVLLKKTRIYIYIYIYVP